MTTRMRALKTFRPGDAKESVRPGQEYLIKESHAKQHEQRGMAVRIKGQHKAPQLAGPLSRAGGRTGEAASSSSSRPGRARSRRKASSRKPSRKQAAAAV